MIDPKWEQTFASRSWGQYPGEDLIRFIARTKPRRVLEIGCGPGANLWMLARAGIEFDAIDGSPTAVSQAKERLDRETPGWTGRIITGDFCHLPDDFRDYDAAIDSQALSCVTKEQAKQVIAELLKRATVLWSRAFAPGSTRTDGARITTRLEIAELYGLAKVGEISRFDGQTVREWIIETNRA